MYSDSSVNRRPNKKLSNAIGYGRLPKDFARVIALLLVFGGITAPTFLSAAPSLDAHGWTVFSPSVDTRQIHVSNSTGNDANSGLSQSTPVKTIAKGVSLLRNGYPDWLLLKKGDSWTNEAFGNVPSGRSANEPMLIGSYGTGARPLVKTIAAQAITSNGALSGYGNYLAVVGIEFYAHARDPNSSTFVNPPTDRQAIALFNPVNWLLIEDSKFRFYGVAIQIFYCCGGRYNNQNISIRRNIIVDSYNIAPTNSSGILIGQNTNLLLEENLFDRNGWNEKVPGAGAVVFNHNVYIQGVNYSGDLSTLSGPATVKGNIFARDASGSQFRSGGTVENNLFIASPYGHNLGQPWSGFVSTVKNNVHLNQVDNFVNGGNVTAYPSLNTFSSYNGDLYNLGTAIISNNVLAHGKAAAGTGGGVFLDAGQAGNTVANNIACDVVNPLVDLGTGNQITNNTNQAASCDGLSFNDPNRTVASYDANVLSGPGTLDHFLMLARAQNKDNWNLSLTANAVNTFIRAGFNVGNSTKETIAPSVPSGLQGGALSSTQVNLVWSASTDNVGVAGYNVFRNGIKVGTSVNTSFADAALLAGTTYTYTVSAYDAAGNTSAQSAGVSIGTPSPLPVITISSPGNGAIFSTNTNVKIAVSASDSIGIASISIRVNGDIIQTCKNATSCSSMWQQRKTTQGTHAIAAEAVNAAGMKSTSATTVIILDR